MDKLEAMRSFVGVVSHEGFSAAAREMGLSRSAVSKHVLDLEAALGVQLLNRTTRQVSPTEAGLVYYERARAILAELEAADITVSRQQDEPRGLLRLNAPMSFGTLHLGPALADFMANYPELQVQMTLNDRFVDPVAEGFDMTVRIAELSDSTLVARRIAPAHRVICATPEYLARRGTPQTPEDLRQHDCLHYGNLATGMQWKLTGEDGDHWVAVKARLCANNGEVLRAAALKGLGIALLPTFEVGMDLQEGRLAAVLDDFHAPPVNVYALYPPGRYLSAKVRLLIDFLVERFGGRPYWDLIG